MRNKKSIAFFLLVVAMSVTPALARSSVQIGGITFHCENTCVLDISPDLMISISDSEGGRAYASIP